MRLRNLESALEGRGIRLALVQHMVDLYYLTGTIQPGFLAVAPDHEPVFFVRKAVERARTEALPGLEIRSLGSPKELPLALVEAGFAPSPGILGLELDVLPYLTVESTKRLFPGAQVSDVGGLLRSLRQVKDEAELAAMRGAGLVWQATMEAIRTSFRPGMDEFDLALAAEEAARRAGHQGLVRTRALDFEIFLGHLLTGPHGAVPTRFDGPTGGPGVHPSTGQGAGHRRILRDEPILADYASAKDGYIYDGTRTFVWGTLSPKLADAYRITQEIHHLFRREALPGRLVGDVVAKTFEIARSHGLEEHFMGYGPDRVRFLGHGVGLELDELPVLLASSQTVFEANMTVAVEPKFVFPGKGAVGLEVTYRITPEGPEALVSSSEDVTAVMPSGGEA